MIDPGVSPEEPRSPDDHLVFSALFEELFVKRLGPQLTPAIRDELRAVGMDLDRKLLPAYTMTVSESALVVVATRLFADLPRDDAFRKLGAVQVEAFARTFLGAAVFGVMKLLSPERFVRRLARAWRSTNNFTETRVSVVAPNRFELWINDVGRYPQMGEGIITAAFARVGHPAEVSVLRREGIACVFQIVVSA